MDFPIELRVQDAPIGEDELAELLTLINRSEPASNAQASTRVQTKKVGDFASYDPLLWKLIVDIANVGALSIFIKGLFEIIVEWQRSRSQKIMIKVGEVSVEVPAHMPQEQVLQLTDKISTIARTLETSQRNIRKG